MPSASDLCQGFATMSGLPRESGPFRFRLRPVAAALVAMALLVGFVAVHLLMVAVVPKTLWAMIVGRKEQA